MKALPELKNVFELHARTALLDGAYAADAGVIGGRRLMLLDDLYRSGATLAAVARVLLDPGGAADVRTLALTRTRSRR